MKIDFETICLTINLIANTLFIYSFVAKELIHHGE